MYSTFSLDIIPLLFNSFSSLNTWNVRHKRKHVIYIYQDIMLTTDKLCLLKFKLDNCGLRKHIHKKERWLHIYTFFQKGCGVLSAKCIQIWWELGKHKVYHLMNMANIEKYLQNIDTNQNLDFSYSIKKFLHPSFVTRNKVWLCSQLN